MKQVSVWIVVLCLFVIGGLLIWVDNPLLGVKTTAERGALMAWLLAACLVVLFLESLVVLAVRKLAALELFSRVQHTLGDFVLRPDRDRSDRDDLHVYLYKRHGHFWRRKVRLLLIVGEPEQIEAIAPGLKEKRWLVDEGAVLLWGGSVQKKVDDSVIERCRRLTRWRALDGVVWALSAEQSAANAAMRHGVDHLQDLAHTIGWSLPLHFWQVCASNWVQDKRPSQVVGCALPSRLNASDLEMSLHSLLGPMREEGWAQMNKVMAHDFLVRLARDLEVEGVARWRKALAPWFGTGKQEVPLRGLWFSLRFAATTQDENEHFWPMDPAWKGVLGEPKQRNRRLGWSTPRVAYGVALTVALVWGAGMLLSFISNRVQIHHLQTSLTTLQQAAPGDAQLSALNELTRELGRLDYRATHGTPWYQRFGLD